jgi:NodT family efflux transporter outer membrane factor (OMF) lipoprotein
LVTGCTTGPREWLGNGLKVGPNYCRPAAPVAETWIDQENPDVVPQATDYSYWWAQLNDPVLDDLVQTAYQQNLPLRIAAMRVLEARAQRAVAVGSLFPQQQQAVGSFSRSKFSQKSFPFGQIPLPKTAYDQWSLGFDAAWELDFWGRFRRGVEAADAQLDAQIENYDDVLVILQAEVAATYVELRTQEERLALARKNLAIQEQTLRITRDRFEGEVVSELDVQQSRAIVAATASLIPQFESGRRQAQNRLCVLMGMPPQDLQRRLGGPGTIPQTPPDVHVGIPAQLLRRRPDVRRAEREVAAQCARIGIAESDLYPQISILGTIAYEAESLSQLFNDDSIAGSVGPGFRWNILNYGRLRNNVLVQDARFQQLAMQYQQTVLSANEEVENAIVAFLNEKERVEILQEGVDALGRAVELSGLQYEQGLIDFQRVLDSQRALVVEQDTLARTRGTVAVQLVAIYKALGGGWQMREPLPPALEAIPAQEANQLPETDLPAAPTDEPLEAPSGR